MTTLLSAERYKLLHSRVTAVILLIIAAMKTFVIWVPYIMGLGFQTGNEPHGNIAGSTGGAAATGSPSGLLGQNGVKLMGGESTILLILLIAFVGFFVASEFQNGTIRNILSLGKRRSMVFMSKILGVFAVLTAIFAITIAIAIVGYSLQYGFGDMGFVEFIGYFAWNFFMQLLYHMPYAAVFCMIAFIARSTGLSIILGIGYLIFNSIAQSFPGSIPGLQFATKLFPEYYINDFGQLGGDMTFIISSVLVSVAYIVLACAIGCIVFKKCDVK